MVLCIVVGYGTKTGNKDGIGMFRIPSVVKNQGEQMQELTTTRRERWISAISRGDTDHKKFMSYKVNEFVAATLCQTALLSIGTSIMLTGFQH